jgi:hypothetical protein
MPEGIFLFQKTSDLFPIALRELRPRFLFFIFSFSHVFRRPTVLIQKRKRNPRCPR